MKIYRVDLAPTEPSDVPAVYKVHGVDGMVHEAEIFDPTVQLRRTTALVRAPSAAAARRHVLEIVSVRIANQGDMLLAVGEDAIEIETVSGSGEGQDERA